MTYEEAIGQAKAGKRVRRKQWVATNLIFDDNRLKLVDKDNKHSLMFEPHREELFAKDWMVVE